MLLCVRCAVTAADRVNAIRYDIVVVIIIVIVAIPIAIATTAVAHCEFTWNN